jgi:hypothetical protein
LVRGFGAAQRRVPRQKASPPSFAQLPFLRLSLQPSQDDDDDDDDDDDRYAKELSQNTVAFPPLPFREVQMNLSLLGRQSLESTMLSNFERSVCFSLAMLGSGAMLGPFLDTYHSAFGVLAYDDPTISLQWWWNDGRGIAALVTTWWVPPLFGLAGFLIGWLYIVLDDVEQRFALAAAAAAAAAPDMNEPPHRDDLVETWSASQERRRLYPSPPKILFGIALFTFQYWLSGVLFDWSVDRTAILGLLSFTAALGFGVLDGSLAGLAVSAATAVGGPLIELCLLTLSAQSDSFLYGSGYHYSDLGETGFFPLWIVPVYFLGGPANGNLARGYWNALTHIFNVAGTAETSSSSAPLAKRREAPCRSCDDSRRVSCPNWYVTSGAREIILVSEFSQYHWSLRLQ